QLAAIWAQVLKVEKVGRADNFFELGGHSLLATQVISRIRHDLDLEWPLHHLFDHPVFADFAGFATPLQAQAPRMVAVDRSQPILGSYAQQRQWFLWQLQPDSAAYNMATALRLTGALDVAALQASFQGLVERHETLRTTFAQEGDEVVQIIHAQARFPAIQPVDVPVPASLASLVEACTREPFDLREGPLLRVALLRLGSEEHVLVVTLHHIICDGWSLPIMVDELVQRYEAHVRGERVSLPALAVQYADYAAWQRQWMVAGEQARQLAYWQARLGTDHPVLALPVDRTRPAVQSHAGARVAIDIEAGLARSLKQVAKGQGVTLFMLLLASFQTLLHRYSGQPDIRVGVPIANRNRVETEQLIGFFVNTQVLRAEFDLHTTFSGLLEQVRLAALGAQAHQDLPFEQLVEALHPQRSLSHSPLFQVMYNHQTQAHIPRRSLPGLSVEAVVASRETAQFDLTLDTFEHAQGIGASMSYASALFDESTVRRLAEHWRNLLLGIVACPEQRVAQLPLFSAVERERSLQDGRRAQADYPREQPLHSLIEAQVERTPDAVALVYGEQTMTYRQLNQRANQLALKLRELGVGPDTLVGIAVERGVEMLVGLLGILKAGGAYVPLDPEYPRERLAYMMEHSGATLLLTQAHLASQIPSGQARTWCLDTDWPQIAQYPTANLASVTASHHLAYCIYTSGSTGKPKGVAVSHQALINFLASMAVQPGLKASDRVLALTSLSFDIAGLELYLPLWTGAAVVLLADGQNKDPQALLRLIEQQAVTTVQATPSTWRMLMEVAGPQTFLGRKLLTGGEALAPDLAERMLAQGGEVWNLYGPTETTIWSAARRLSRDNPAPLLGGPIANTTLYVLDTDLGAVPPGVAGELLIGGDGLARGYLHRSALTAERFIPDPNGSGGRLYRTGDLARLQAGGELEYSGRIDHQVKIRGLRIELGEIEARLLEHVGIREAVVVDVDSETGRQLVAYLVVGDAAIDVDIHQLRVLVREHLAATLPDYMMPAQVISLPHLPLTPNGKLDRKALPKPDVSHLQQVYLAPRSELEQQVAVIWADVLKVERVGLGDHFFELGGHSLLATQVITRIRQQLDLEVALRELFERPVLSDFTQGLEGRDRQSNPLHDDLAKSLEALKRLSMEEIDDLIS
ncbi:amino acid adenylation domain-containing protein, partial [Pseudomonas sp. RIT-To-2]|uniref:amino acid adenylation domain-containing protein n=1 Tax=Pseudomonas sp. RIT-To-2 TaxID=3462541 RepID=UPI00241342F2